MNTIHDLWSDHPLPARLRWRLLDWTQRSRPGPALDTALTHIAPRLGLDPADRPALEAAIARNLEPALDLRDEDFLAQLGIGVLAQRFALSGLEQSLLALLVQFELDDEINDWLARLDGALGASWLPHLRLLADLLGVHSRVLAGLLSARGTLVRVGLVVVYRRSQVSLDSRFEVRDEVIEYCADPARDLERVTQSYFTACGPRGLALDAYPQLAPSLPKPGTATKAPAKPGTATKARRAKPGTATKARRAKPENAGAWDRSLG